MTYIYALIDPRTQECRYVGKADNPTTRLRKHLTSISKYRTHKTAWLNKLLKAGHRPELVQLERVAKSEWVEAECFWIEYFKFIGARLTNATNGGEGAEGFKHSEESRRRLSALAKARMAIFNPNKGTTRSEECKKMLSEKARGRKLSEATRKKISESGKLARQRPDVLERLKAVWARPVTEETRKKISEAGKGRTKSEETRKKLSKALKGKVRSAEHSAKISAANKGKTISIEARAKMSAAGRGRPKSLEHIAKMAESKRAYWDKWREENEKEPNRSTKRRWKNGEIPHPAK